MRPYPTQKGIREKTPLIPKEQSGQDSSNMETQKIAKCLGTHLEERSEDNFLIHEN